MLQISPIRVKIEIPSEVNHEQEKSAKIQAIQVFFHL